MIILPSSAGIYRPASSGSFNPNSISNRLFWLSQGVGMLDASNNPVTTSGSTIATWQDQSGNNNHFTGQATYLDAANAGNGNGQGVISHNNTSDYFWRNISLSADFTIFVVQKPTSSIGLPFYDGAMYLGAYDAASSLSNDNLLGTVTFRQNGLDAGIPNRNDLYAINYNKLKLLTIEGTGVTDYASSTQLRLWDYAGYRQGGQTAEVFWVSRNVTSTERANLENYFMTKYGIVAPYTSLPVSGAALWLDGSRLDSLYTTDTGSTNVTTNAGAIGRWEDLSGNARHAKQATAGSRPTWVSPASGINGLGATIANGSTQFLTLDNTSSWGLVYSGDFTINAVIKATSTGGVIIGQSNGPGTTPKWSLGYGSNGIVGSGQLGFHYAGGGSSGFVRVAWSPTAGTYYRITATRTGNDHLFFVNGVQQGTTQTTASRPGLPTNALTVFQFGNGDNSFFGGQVAELTVYASYLSGSQITDTNTYFSGKWGT